MGLLSGKRIRRRKKEVPFFEGYFIDSVDTVTPGLNENDETFHFYGNDSPETDKQINYGTLTIGVMDTFEANKLLALLTEQDPEEDTEVNPQQYRIADLQAITIWTNVKNSDNTKYIRSTLFSGWAPSMPLESGNANDKATYSIGGNCDFPRKFEGSWIQAKKIASGQNLGVTPLQVPREETGIFAVHVRAIDETGGIFDQEVIPVSTAMLSSAGVISWTEIEALVQNLAAVTHAYFLFLQSGSGVYPSNRPDGLRA
jgi:hypothetical protein